jgi:membrane fusion protein (multidrug efflux system)
MQIGAGSNGLYEVAAEFVFKVSRRRTWCAQCSALMGVEVNGHARQQAEMRNKESVDLSHIEPEHHRAAEHTEHAGTVTSFSERVHLSSGHSTGMDAGDVYRVSAEGESGNSRKWVLLIVVALVVAVGAWVYLRKPGPAAPLAATTSAPLQLASVDLAKVESRVLSRVLPLSGSMAPVVQATVKAKVGGEIQQLTVREGQDVREGDVIARIDTRNLQAQYDRELAAVDKARAELQLATLNRDKNRQLLDQKYISQNTFEATESAYAGNVASLKLAEANARLAKIDLDDAVVRAPFAGTIAKRLVQPGEKVSADSSIVTLVDLRHMLLEAAVPAAEIPAINVGQPVRFRVGGFGQRQFDGEVQRINPITAEGSRAITVYIAVANADRALKGGMFAQGELVLNSNSPVMSIPAAAVKYESAVPVVYTLEGDRIRRQQITLGIQTEGNAYVEVSAGLKAGDRVILADIGDHKPGSIAVVREAKRT